MKLVGILLVAAFALPACDANAAWRYSLHPTPVFPGQPAYLRIDDSDGCFEFDQQTVKASPAGVEVEIWISDFVATSCLPQHATPVLIPLGTFEAGSHVVEVTECGLIPVNPCGQAALLTLDVGGMPRRKTLPVLGWVALLMLCSGVLALAFTIRPGATPR
jgi:hypothetical protein